MNWYFWFFSLYALLITPLQTSACIRFGRDVRYRVRFRVAGFPAGSKRWKANEEEKVDSRRLAKGMIRLDKRLVWNLIRSGEVKRMLGAVRLEAVTVHARLSFQDAAATALCFAAVRTFLQTMALCAPERFVLKGRVDTDFRAQGTEVMVECMVWGRLGNLLAGGVRLLAACVRARANLLKQEENNAASY